ncbi:carbon monoxide dehydrogenase subunit G [Kribbella steppae]|uniref:Carbon monoxide dehydrogenase subunit G n=1 Tax=Kribbella steppae TaxID=2512223 RepID=A0A4R2HV06_9ACTN|nr:SRPBCC domain-containing protein [Kribbella steppae]TCO35311.1 carbon monoxide dehydrogenase subunit G [Kribbella steppae]
MKLEHKFVVPAPVEEAWAAFNDLERVVPCFPGATLTSYDGDGFAGTCKVKLGPVSLTYSGTGTFVERDPADHHAVVEAKGKDRRGNSTASVRVTARLDASGDTATAVTVETDLTVTGRPAQFGRGLIQDVSDHLLAEFVTCLTTTLTTQSPPTTAKPTAPTAGSSSAATESSAPAAESSGSAAKPTAPAVKSSGQATESSGSATGPTASTTEPTASATRPATPTGAAGVSNEPTSQAQPAPSGEPTAGASTLDLGSALVPALVRRARPYLIGAVLALLIRRLLRR